MQIASLLSYEYRGIAKLSYNIINAVHRDGVLLLPVTTKREVYTLHIIIYIIIATVAFVLHCEQACAVATSEGSQETRSKN